MKKIERGTGIPVPTANPKGIRRRASCKEEKRTETLKRRRERISRENSETDIKITMGKKPNKVMKRAEKKRETEDLKDTVGEIDIQEKRQDETIMEIPTTDESSAEETSCERHQEISMESQSNEKKMNETDSATFKKKRDINIKKNKLIRVNGKMMYEEDMEEQRVQSLGDDNRYKSNHVGWKIVEASLISSARVTNNESNKLKILRYCHEKLYKVDTVRNRGFGKLELIFANYKEANDCLSDKRSGSREKIVEFNIPKRAKTCKGVIASWDLESTLDELYDAILNKDMIVEIERMKTRKYDKTSKKLVESRSHLVIITWEGNSIPNEVRLYGGVTGLKIRPYVESVLQCYNCYGFGHLAKHCKNKKVCMMCAQDFHGHCDLPAKCINCGGGHKPQDKRCEKFQINIEIKKLMANSSLNVSEARERILGSRNSGRSYENSSDQMNSPRMSLNSFSDKNMTCTSY